MARTVPFASAERCPAEDSVCLRAHALEPQLPVLPAFNTSRRTGRNPCLELESTTGGKREACLPGATVLSAWHSLAEPAIASLLGAQPAVRLVRGACFGTWQEDEGAARWVRSFGAPERGTLLVQQCESLLQW